MIDCNRPPPSRWRAFGAFDVFPRRMYGSAGQLLDVVRDDT